MKVILIIIVVLVLIFAGFYLIVTHNIDKKDTSEEENMTEEEKMEERIAFDKAMDSYRKCLKKGIKLNVKPPRCERPENFDEKLKQMKKLKGRKETD